MAKGKLGQHVIWDTPFAARVLLLLLDKGEQMATDLLVISGNYVKLKEVARQLGDAGLVEIRIDNRPRVTFTYELTSKGKKVAQKLKEIEGMLEG